MLVLPGLAGALDPPGAAAADPVIAAAGDIACSSSSSNYNGGNGTADKCRQRYTSDLLVNKGLAVVLPLGDAQYDTGTLSGFNKSYDLSWGRVKSISRPAPGNHEYKTTGAAGYYDYFNGSGVASGPAGDRSKGYYSFNVGTWHLIALNSTDHCTIISCAAGSAQDTWLKADLAANASKYCTLAYWHDPRFNSGHDGNADEMAALFKDLYDADADVVLGGHAHDYERFAPQNPNGQLDNARGIRQFVVGTGGAFWTGISTPKPNSQVRQNSTYGVLKLTLHPSSYDWQFASESNKPFSDSGTGQCHGSSAPPPSDTQKPTAPANLSASASTGQVALSWTASTDNVGVTGYKVYRGGSEIASIGTVTSYTDTTVAGGTSYSYTVRATDAAGNLSDPSNTATATTPAASNLTIAPDADAMVNSSAPGTNYATAKLRTDAGSTPDESYLRFTVGGVAGSVQSAKLRLFAYTSTVDGPAVYSTTNSWNESTLTWNTRPLPTSAARDDKGAIASGSWVEWDVTPFVTGNGTYSFNLAQPGTDGVDFRSREYTTNRPELKLTVGVDPQQPTAPANLQATAGSGQVALSWQAATDNVGVTSYRISQGAAQVASVGGSTTSYTDTGLAPGSYSYTVRAIDAAQNLSDPSNSASATVPDTTKPSAPANLQATANGSTRVDLTWDGSTDDVGVSAYRLYRDGQAIATTSPTPSYSDTVLPGTHTYEVRALDAAGNVSNPSNSATVTLTSPDGEAPTPPANLTATVAGGDQVDLAWDGSSDNVGVAGYEVYRDDQVVATTSGETSYSDTVSPGSYTYEVRAVDAAGNASDPSDAVPIDVPDTEQPTAPANLTATAVGSSRIDLGWDASTDNVGVTGYEIYRDGALLTTIGTTTSYSDGVLAPATHTYEVRALDAEGNRSDASSSATATVTPPDTAAPTPPSNLGAVGSTGRVDLAWEASIDDAGVTGYRIYRDGLLATSIGTATSYADVEIAPGTYTYVVRAVDAAGNVSDASNAADATVPDTEPSPVDLTLGPDADARVDAGTPSTNYATSKLRTDAGSTPEESVLRFTVSGVEAGTVRSATLRIYAYTGTADGPGVFTTAASWSETAVNWSTRPARTSGLIDDKGAIPSRSWVEYDVTPFVTGSGTYSFGLATSSSDGVDFRSREYATDRPELLVHAGPPDTQQPSAPSALTWTATSPTSVDLAWQPATDNVAVADYLVYRGGGLLATTDTTAYTDTTVSRDSTYTYQARAVDTAGNVSNASAPVTATTPAASSVLTLAPVADARVHEGSPGTNYGTSYLRANGGGEPAVESYLRFTVSGVPPGGVQSAVLRVYAYSRTVDGPAVLTTDPSWSEGTVSWSNRPPHTSSPIDDKGSIPSGSWVEYDVTPFVTQNGTYSFGLTSTSTDGVNIYSREAATRRPELVVITP